MTPSTFSLITTAFANVDITAKTFDLTTLFNGLSPNDRVAKLKAWAVQQANGDDEFAKRLDRAYRRWLAVQHLGGWPQSTADMVALFMDHHKITVAFNGMMSSPQRRGQSLDLAIVTSDLSLISGEIGVGYSDKAIGHALKRFTDKAKDQRIKDALAVLDGTGPVPAPAEWTKLADAFVDDSAGKASRHLAIRLLQTAMWQIKRRLADDPAFPVHAHLMVVLCGPQEAGKTNLWNATMAPIEDCVAQSNCAAITNATDMALPTFPVVFMDEMQNFERSDMEAFKNCVTRNTVTARTLYTNGNATVRVRNTFIGATNGTLADKINDTTGLRRFGAIHTKYPPNEVNEAAGLPLMDWEAINSVDVLALWRSVDWRAAHPLQSDPVAKAEWLALIEGERNQDSVETWLRQLRASDLFNPEHGLTTSELYTYPDSGYADWAKTHGFGAGSAATLGKRLAKFEGQPWNPLERSPTKSARGTLYLFKERPQAGVSPPGNVTPIGGGHAQAILGGKAKAMNSLRHHLGNKRG